MNRKKKINQVFKKKVKQANARLNGKAKPRYISKAERLKLEQDSDSTTGTADTESIES
ncbi:DUF2986 domain-containing protein [Dasania marina]|uniref:DUF2986 domain-containing protein n=1 Tax=Dasania marina TaxID=471499 RepID=UPI0003757CF6|nr:DUF2986 domain-containing protein [Dasania marina]|tara:strand:- start:36844 stop:37017 length:174 start_codon:yes stop_codon:yes gene_type:complete